ncbi:MAG TPA: DUF3500 domain-containing protein [Pirellulales bacterium]|nr:DUF3500 domain-containing protein [Pirellulales bacterium]
MPTRKPLIIFALILLGSGGAMAALNYRPSAADMTQSAEKFLAGLSAEQRAQASMAFDDPARLDWHFIPKDKRKGLQIKEMNADQRKLAHALLATGVSKLGYQKATTIMELEKILRALEKGMPGKPIRDPQRYYFTVFGEPGSAGRWGWSVEGHHLSLNFVVDAGKLASITPAFYGANPAEVQSDVGVGPPKGTRVLRHEEELGFKLLHALSAEQRARAVIAEKAPNDLRAAGEPQAPDTPPEGLPVSAMTEEQVTILRTLLAAYTDNMLADEGAARQAEIRAAGIEKLHFAWAGADHPGVGHYYRVQGPTFLIEFCNTQPDGAGNPANHIHTVWRRMAGDFGIER